MYDYEPLRKLVLAQMGRPTISDKEMGVMIGVSERQIRNARFKGMDEWMCDKFCTAFKYHPMEVYGYDWITPESLFIADRLEAEQAAKAARKRGRRKKNPDGCESS